eukprot:TRINITY_DN3285_c0_g1_i2.p1 TRINITY_DN3285_c0_g1~~TRINITY_DN3285_c0_g1_i2.p1  ORF type:complete len:225 (+),score=34.14 TRINITY_DN3285_c0_g1_i2:218-892(+)
MQKLVALERYVTIPNGKVFYQEWNKGEKISQRPPLLLLHGMMQTSHTWDDFAPYAASNYRVIAMDQRGHGKTFASPNKDYSTSAMTQDIKQVLDELKVPQVDLIGFSMGAGNSISFSARFPEMVRSLVLVDFAPTINPEGKAKLAASFNLSWPSFEEAVDAIWKANPKRTRENIKSRVLHSLAEKKDGTWGWRFDLEGLQSKFTDPESREELWGLASQIKCPVY